MKLVKDSIIYRSFSLFGGFSEKVGENLSKIDLKIIFRRT